MSDEGDNCIPMSILLLFCVIFGSFIGGFIMVFKYAYPQMNANTCFHECVCQIKTLTPNCNFYYGTVCNLLISLEPLSGCSAVNEVGKIQTFSACNQCAQSDVTGLMNQYYVGSNTSCVVSDFTCTVIDPVRFDYYGNNQAMFGGGLFLICLGSLGIISIAFGVIACLRRGYGQTSCC